MRYIVGLNVIPHSFFWNFDLYSFLKKNLIHILLLLSLFCLSYIVIGIYSLIYGFFEEKKISKITLNMLYPCFYQT